MPTLLLGNCLEKLAEMPDCSIDAIITDPPYGLSFMGKKWDYDVPGEDIWRECLRVLKPGGHLLAFAGTRTQHRMAVRIEDAGFEIRDMIAWVYGSGFPKSLDVSKAIDKTAPRRGQFDAFAKHFTECLTASGKKQKEVAALFPSKTGGLTGCVWNWANGANVPTKAQWDVLQPLLGLSDEFSVLIDRVEAEREVVGQGSSAISTRKELQSNRGTVWGADSSTFNITAPATPEAQQWDGWGTALKPALEPITVARKPFKGTVAANVLAHGTGGINVDGCRVGTANTQQRCSKTSFGLINDDAWQAREVETGSACGRWPANLIHDGSDEVVGLFPQTGISRGGNSQQINAGTGRYNWNTGTDKAVPDGVDPGYGDSGSCRPLLLLRQNKQARTQCGA
jgi:hypothetical protein